MGYRMTGQYDGLF